MLGSNRSAAVDAYTAGLVGSRRPGRPPDGCSMAGRWRIDERGNRNVMNSSWVTLA